MCEEQAKEQRENDKCIHNESHAEIAREIAVKLEVNEPEIYSDMEAVAKIIDGDMNEYGIMNLDWGIIFHFSFDNRLHQGYYVNNV